MLLWQQNLLIETGYANKAVLWLQWPIPVHQKKKKKLNHKETFFFHFASSMLTLRQNGYVK